MTSSLTSASKLPYDLSACYRDETFFADNEWYKNDNKWEIKLIFQDKMFIWTKNWTLDFF